MSEWISVEDGLPPEDLKAWWWLVPKLPEECPHNTSGKPIVANFDPYMEVKIYGHWSCLSKPKYWQHIPDPPE